jgi:hypothetical protein
VISDLRKRKVREIVGINEDIRVEIRSQVDLRHDKVDQIIALSRTEVDQVFKVEQASSMRILEAGNHDQLIAPYKEQLAETRTRIANLKEDMAKIDARIETLKPDFHAADTLARALLAYTGHGGVTGLDAMIGLGSVSESL